MESTNEPTLQDVLNAVNAFATNTEERFTDIVADLTSVKDEITFIKADLTSVKDEITFIKTDLTSVKDETRSMRAVMVTKDYLDDKLADLRGDILAVIRKEDKRLSGLIEILQRKDLLSVSEVQVLEQMQPMRSLE